MQFYVYRVLQALLRNIILQPFSFKLHFHFSKNSHFTPFQDVKTYLYSTNKSENETEIMLYLSLTWFKNQNIKCKWPKCLNIFRETLILLFEYGAVLRKCPMEYTKNAIQTIELHSKIKLFSWRRKVWTGWYHAANEIYC